MSKELPMDCPYCNQPLTPGVVMWEGHAANCPAVAGPCPRCGATQGDETCWNGKKYYPDCPIFHGPNRGDQDG